MRPLLYEASISPTQDSEKLRYALLIVVKWDWKQQLKWGTIDSSTSIVPGIRFTPLECLFLFSSIIPAKKERIGL